MVVILGLIAGVVDYNRIKKDKIPIFCILFTDDSTCKVTYIGVGYKVIRYTGFSINEPFKNNIGVRFGLVYAL